VLGCCWWCVLSWGWLTACQAGACSLHGRSLDCCCVVYLRTPAAAAGLAAAHVGGCLCRGMVKAQQIRHSSAGTNSELCLDLQRDTAAGLLTELLLLAAQGSYHPLVASGVLGILGRGSRIRPRVHLLLGQVTITTSTHGWPSQPRPMQTLQGRRTHQPGSAPTSAAASCVPCWADSLSRPAVWCTGGSMLPRCQAAVRNKNSDKGSFLAERAQLCADKVKRHSGLSEILMNV
jgi:hypothetical protein